MDLTVTGPATILAEPDLFTDLSRPVHYRVSDRLKFKKIFLVPFQNSAKPSFIRSILMA